jgi:hypothetical protein
MHLLKLTLSGSEYRTQTSRKLSSTEQVANSPMRVSGACEAVPPLVPV